MGCNACGYNWYTAHYRNGNPTQHFNQRCGCCGGTQSQQDVCKNVCAGAPAPPPQATTTTTTTTTTQAPQNCAGVWEGWSACSASCGGGTQSRSFTIQRNPAYGGSSCPSRQSQPCNGDACPVDCVGSWAVWSTCSSPCGGGQQSRRHTITTQAANGGIQCPPAESQPCSPLPCPVNCAGSWGAWSLCSEECGGGTQARTFNATTAPAHGGAECPTPESQQCSSSPCPVHCRGTFAAWTPCSKSCGGGTQS